MQRVSSREPKRTQKKLVEDVFDAPRQDRLIASGGRGAVERRAPIRFQGPGCGKTKRLRAVDIPGSCFRGERCAFKRDAHKRGRSTISRWRSITKPKKTSARPTERNPAYLEMNRPLGFEYRKGPSTSKDRDTKEYAVCLHMLRKRSMLDGRGRAKKHTQPTVRLLIRSENRKHTEGEVVSS